jgi:hypothetical protein
LSKGASTSKLIRGLMQNIILCKKHFDSRISDFEARNTTSGYFNFFSPCTDKKENIIFLIYKEIQKGAVAKSYMRKGFLIQYMRKCGNTVFSHI